mgnify:CR=1 FL=1
MIKAAFLLNMQQISCDFQKKKGGSYKDKILGIYIKIKTLQNYLVIFLLRHTNVCIIQKSQKHNKVPTAM